MACSRNLAFVGILWLVLISHSRLAALAQGALPIQQSISTNTARQEVKAVEALHKLNQAASRIRRQYNPYLRAAANDDLFMLRSGAPRLFAFQPSGATGTFVEDSGVIREGYESAGKLYFPLDRTPSMGVHSVGLYQFRREISQVDLPSNDFGALYYSHRDPTAAILQAYSKRNTERNYFWSLKDGRLRQVGGPGTPVAIPQSQKPLTCIAQGGSVSFFGSGFVSQMTRKALSKSTHGISLEAGVTVGCRRVGTTKLLWLTSDETFQDGVTYEVRGQTLTPLFVGHPYIQTTHYLVFTQYDNNDKGAARRYLFIRSD